MSTELVASDGEDIDTYNLVVAGARLQDVKLTKSDFVIKPTYFVARAEDKQIAHSVTMAASEPSYDEEYGIMMGEIEWTVTAKSGRTLLVKLTGRYLVAYSGVPPVEHSHLVSFIRRVARFAAYPYFRNLVAQASWASGAELPILPILK